MPIVNKGINTVTPGTVCYGCVKLETGECPYGNKYGDSTLVFKGDPGTNTCGYYEAYPEDTWGMEAKVNNKMKKEADKMSEAELNFSLYKKIIALDKGNAKKLLNYWSRIYPEDYAEDLVTNTNESAPKDTSDKQTPEKKEFKKKKFNLIDKKKDENKKNKFFD